MQDKAPEPKKLEMESAIRDFGVKPSAETRDKLRRELESQKEKFIAIERVHGKSVDRDLSR